MSDQFQTGPFDPSPFALRRHPPLPKWLAQRLLRAEERVAWVGGPRFNPSWERYVTHPGLFVVALALTACLVAAGRLAADSWAEFPVVFGMAAVAIVLGSIFVLGLANGYFTRLVATNYRLVVLQGYEVCRSWDIDHLPPALVRRSRLEGGQDSITVNLDALGTMLGTSDQFVDAKTILSFSKQLGHIKRRDDDRS